MDKTTLTRRAQFDHIMTLIQSGALEEAQQRVTEVRRLAPHDLNYLNLAAWLAAQRGEHDRAIALYRQLLTHTPQHSEARFNMHRAEAIRAELAGDVPAALAALRTAAVLAPAHEAVRSQIALLQRQLCDFTALSLPAVLPPADAMVLTADPAAQRQAAEAWARQHFGAIRPLPPVRAQPKDRLTLGFLSGDYHQHATAHLIAELFELLDRRVCAVHGYSIGPDDGSPQRARLARGCDAFADLRGLDARQAAGRIRADGVDILIDMKGYTRGGRLDIAAHRPAPLQLHWLGFPGTLGADFIDYFVADRVALPLELAAHFTEKILWLPGCYQINDRQRPLPPPLPRAHYGLPEGVPVLASFNQTYKLTPDLLGLWAEILHDLPRAVLWLLATNAYAPDNIRGFMAGQGIDASRLHFAEPCALEPHLQRYHAVDLALDTFPVGGHTTTSDALWLGVPVVTLPGPCFVSRVAASLLTATGLPELVAADRAGYKALALDLARDAARRGRIKAYLTENRLRLPPFAPEVFVKNFMAGLQSVWQRTAADLPPAHVTMTDG